MHGADRLAAPLRSHAAAHRPARAVGGVRPACCRSGRSAFTSDRRRRRSISAREVTAGEIARAELEANRIVWEDRPGHDPVRRRGGSREPAAAQRTDARRRAAADRRRRLRRLGLRRHARGAHRARSASSPSPDPSASGRHPGRVPVRRPGARRLPRARATAWRRACGCCRCCRRSCPPQSSGCRPRRATSRRQLKDLQARLAAHEAAALADARRTRRAARVVVAALDGWDANGLKTIAAAIAARPGHAAVLVERSPRRRRSSSREHGSRRSTAPRSSAADGNVRRQGRRPAGAGAGRRTTGRSGSDLVPPGARA